MKIEKIGKIFDPRKYKLINNCHEFSQSPQTVVFDDFVRIYFSTREKDKNGKYLSHVTFVDMNKQFQVIEVAKKTVINLGKLGTFDEHGIFPINLLKEDNKILAYTTGWTRRVSVSVDAGIGHAVSYDNGLTFEKLGDGPILGASINEPFLVGDAFVKKYNDIYHMWYIHGTKWVTDNFSKNSERVYKIAHAVSNNGISWQKEGKNIIKDKLNIDECQALPSVIKINNIYHMFFCYRNATDFRGNNEKSYKIGYASSVDLVSWERDDTKFKLEIIDGEWDSGMQCYPHVFEMDDVFYLLYNGDNFGRFGFGLLKLKF